MSQLLQLLNSGFIRQTVFGLSRSHLNSVKLLSVEKGFCISPENVAIVYEGALNYYNAGFAKETGEILRTKNLIDEYINLIILMFSEDFEKEKTVVSVRDIQVQDAVSDYSLFSLFVLLVNYKKLRVSVWEDYETSGFSITTLFGEVYNTCVTEINQSDTTSRPLSFKAWKRVASNIVWNVKQHWELLDS